MSIHTTFESTGPDDAARRFATRTFTWLRQVAADKALRPSDLAICVALTRYLTEHDHDGQAYPSCQTLADDAGLAESTVVRGVRRLEAQGHLTVAWGQQGSGHSNHYWMAEKPAARADKKPARRQVSEAKKTCQAACEPLRTGSKEPVERENARAREASQSDARAPAGAASEERTEPAADRPEARGRRRAGARPTDRAKSNSGTADSDYLQLRKIWIRPWVDDDGAQAWLEFDRAASEVDSRVILAAARKWVANCDSPRFLPSLCKWLVNRGWERDPPQRGRPRPEKAAGPRQSAPRGKPDMAQVPCEM
jgi:DNA-binding transcriptional regulator YhcF (GntR family)